MITLGVNGWTDRTHDPAAALIVDGEVVAFAEQERFSRRKHGVGEYAHDAVRWVIERADVQPDEIDAVAYGWDLALFNAARGRPMDLSPRTILGSITGLEFRRGCPSLHWVGHHDAHAASAFHGSGFSDAAVLVVDAEGEDCSSSIYRAAGREVTLLKRYGRGASLGLLYRAASEYCGFGQYGAGKTMGLAAFADGDPDVIPLRFDDGDFVTPFADDAGEDEIIAGWQALLVERFGPRGAVHHGGEYPLLEAHRPKAAATVQAATERMLIAMARHACDLAGTTRLCMAGGVALNCVSNGLIVDQVTALHIPPATHDAGVALGAALHTIAGSNERLPTSTAADLGPEYSTGAVVDACRAAGVSWRVVDDPVVVASELLMGGARVCWFQGRMEVGPRALGRRSILALPDKVQTQTELNALKGREPWRPLAPSLLAEETTRMFGVAIPSPFMLISRQLTDEGGALAPACRHYDGTARYQTVGPEDSSRYRALLERIRSDAGTGVILNTSFNGPGEPIVDTPAQALARWKAMGIDALVAEEVVVTRSSDTSR